MAHHSDIDKRTHPAEPPISDTRRHPSIIKEIALIDTQPRKRIDQAAIRIASVFPRTAPLPRQQKRGDRTIVFEDHANFTPNVSPADMFRKGVFGGSNFRDIYSAVSGRMHTAEEDLKDFPEEDLRGIDMTKLSSPDADAEFNYFGVRVAEPLTDWEEKGYISSIDPRGWVQWYIRFYYGRRSTDDAHQIRRWKEVTDQLLWQLVSILSTRRIRATDTSNVKAGDRTLHIRQNLLHWGLELTPNMADAVCRNHAVRVLPH